MVPRWSPFCALYRLVVMSVHNQRNVKKKIDIASTPDREQLIVTHTYKID